MNQRQRERDLIQIGLWFWFQFWSYLGSRLLWQEQVGSALLTLRSGPVPKELDLYLTGQTRLEAEFLHTITKNT